MGQLSEADITAVRESWSVIIQKCGLEGTGLIILQRFVYSIILCSINKVKDTIATVILKVIRLEYITCIAKLNICDKHIILCKIKALFFARFFTVAPETVDQYFSKAGLKENDCATFDKLGQNQMMRDHALKYVRSVCSL